MNISETGKSFFSVFDTKNKLTIKSNKHSGFSKSFLKLLDTHSKSDVFKKTNLTAKNLTDCLKKELNHNIENRIGDKSLNNNKSSRGNFQIRNRPGLFRKSKTLHKITTNTHLPIINEKQSQFISNEISQFDSNLKQKLNNINTNIDQGSSSFNSGKKWRKLSNIIRSVSLLNHYHAKALLNDIDVEKDLKDFKEWKLKSSHTVMSTPRYDINEEPTCRELFKLSLKERFLKIILEGNLNSINCLQELFDKNPERFSRDPSDEKFLFNLPMPDGHTLLYTAAKEGNYYVLKYMLEKRLNAKIKSKIGDDEESCLQVASRWNYVNIVQLLLEMVEFGKKDIHEALCVTNKNEKIYKILLEYSKKRFDMSNDAVTCFC